MSGHECPGTGCHKAVPAHMLTCRPHWFMIPKPLRDAVWNAWQDGERAGSAGHVAAITAAIAALNEKLALRA